MRSDYFKMASRILSRAIGIKSLAHSICSVNAAFKKVTLNTQTLESRGENLLDEVYGLDLRC